MCFKKSTSAKALNSGLPPTYQFDWPWVQCWSDTCSDLGTSRVFSGNYDKFILSEKLLISK